MAQVHGTLWENVDINMTTGLGRNSGRNIEVGSGWGLYMVSGMDSGMESGIAVTTNLTLGCGNSMKPDGGNTAGVRMGTGTGINIRSGIGARVHNLT